MQYLVVVQYLGQQLLAMQYLVEYLGQHPPLCHLTVPTIPLCHLLPHHLLQAQRFLAVQHDVEQYEHIVCHVMGACCVKFSFKNTWFKKVVYNLCV